MSTSNPPSPSQPQNHGGAESNFVAGGVCNSFWKSLNDSLILFRECYSSVKRRMYRQRYPHFLLAVARWS